MAQRVVVAAVGVLPAREAGGGWWVVGGMEVPGGQQDLEGAMKV